jgi:hypothetical protein
MRIAEVLARRTDLSTFLVHLTRSTAEATAKQKLMSILHSEVIEARTPFGMAVARLQAAGRSTDSQRCVCFTETPLEHVNLLAEDIEDRNYHFEPYGIAITRRQGRSRGVNPVWYLDISPGHDWLTVPIERLIVDAVAGGNFDEQSISRLAPLIEQMGAGTRIEDGQPYRKEFWWEREWRYPRNFHLPITTFIVLCPTADTPDISAVVNAKHEEFRPDVRYIDPTWSLEMIIGRLAGFGFNELGPF